MPGWKKVQSKRKTRNKTRLGFIVLGLIALLIVFSQIFHFTKTLLSPWKASGSQRTYTWDGRFNINLVFRSKGVAFVSYNPTDQKIAVVDIPDQTYLEAAHGYGKWQLRALFDLGGDQLLKDTLSQFLAQPIDGFLDFSGSYRDKSAKEIIDLVKISPGRPINILSNLKTDLTLMELVRLKFGLAGVRFDKLVQIDLQDTKALTKDHLLDGTEILVADPNLLDISLAILSDPKIKNEHKTIVLFNATDKPLFAQKWARLLTNMGGDVIITSNAKKRVDKTIVAGEASETLTRLQQVFNFECVSDNCDKIQKTDEDMAGSRGQISIKLASDLP